MTDLRTRLFSRLAIDGSGCVLWTGTEDRYGYGKINIQGRWRGVHRVMYELFAGGVPAGLELDHLCRTPLCASVAHLEPVTHQENVLRSGSVAGINGRKTYCKYGHPFDESNTYLYRSRRLCRACNRAAVGRYRSGKRGQS